MAKFIIVTKESDDYKDYKTAINTDEIISITEFDKCLGDEGTVRRIRIKMKNGYWIDVSDPFFEIENQLREEK